MTTPIEHAAEAMWEAIDDKGINGRLNREDCTYLAEALAAAGPIATEIEWGTKAPAGHVVAWSTEENAQTMARLTGHPLQVRYTSTTPWKDADA